METVEITEEIYRLNRTCFRKYHGYAQDAKALASLIATAMAHGPICSIVTPPLSGEDRRMFFAKLYQACDSRWSAEIASQKMTIDERIYTFNVFNVRGKPAAERRS